MASGTCWRRAGRNEGNRRDLVVSIAHSPGRLVVLCRLIEWHPRKRSHCAACRLARVGPERIDRRLQLVLSTIDECRRRRRRKEVRNAGWAPGSEIDDAPPRCVPRIIAPPLDIDVILVG